MSKMATLSLVLATTATVAIGTASLELGYLVLQASLEKPLEYSPPAYRCDSNVDDLFLAARKGLVDSHYETYRQNRELINRSLNLLAQDIACEEIKGDS